MGAPLKWFPFYVDDWETDERVRGLTYEERGVFVTMLCWQWREGSLPSRARDVAVTLRARQGVVTKLLRSFFVEDGAGAGRVANPKLEQVREQQVHRVMENREKAAAYRSRMRVRHGNVTPSSPDRRRERIRSEIEKSLSVADATRPPT